MRIAIVDTWALRPYGAAGESQAGLGGTETTVIAVAEGLSAEAEVTLHQAARAAPTPEGAPGLRCLPFVADDLSALRGADRVIVINSDKVAAIIAKGMPEARVTVWLHVVPGKRHRAMGQDLSELGVGIVCVSERHVALVRDRLHPSDVQMRAIYNPLPGGLSPDGTPRDPDRLFFASSPHKGLAEVIERFAEARAALPGLSLRIADPGYLDWPVDRLGDAGITVLGRLSRAQVIEEMRAALCLFYPQTSFAETFGIVLAEANAVGCPVLVHRGLGANDEVASSGEQLVDGHDTGAIIRTLKKWRAEPPEVTGNPAFALEAVLDAWRAALA